MTPEELVEQLDQEIQKILAAEEGSVTTQGELLAIASELRGLPSRKFREKLRKDLFADDEEIGSVRQPHVEPRLANSHSEPMFTRREFSVLPADPRSLFLSFLSHAAVVVLIASGIWVGRNTIARPAAVNEAVNYLPMPSGDSAPHGGGSGGDHSQIEASRGTPPKFSEEQLTPPAIIVRNDESKLQVQPTVLGPPDLKLPSSERIGDLLSPNIVIPSNGTGARGGMGSNSGTGIGSGKDGGVGPGMHNGFGGDTYRPGSGVSAPRAIYDPDPEYSDEARRAKYQGTVVLSLIVDPSGHARDIRIARSLGMGLDEKAIEAVQKWQFAPGMKDGVAVAVQVNVEVNFRLY